MLIQRAEVPWPDLAVVRAWDLASTKPKPGNRDPDYTAGALVGICDGECYVLDVVRFRQPPAIGVKVLLATHAADDAALGRPVPIRVEQEGGSAGAWSIDQMARREFVGVDFDGIRPSASKSDRARPVSIAAHRGHVHLLDGRWVDDFLDELELFPPAPGEGHDDQVDALSLAWWFLTHGDSSIDETVGIDAGQKVNEFASPGAAALSDVESADLAGDGWGAL